MPAFPRSELEEMVERWLQVNREAEAKGVVCGKWDEPDCELTVCKQRNGEFEGRLKLWLDRQSLRFVDSQESEVTTW